MTKIDIISGFLGAGKTTLIRKLISEAFAGEQIVLIENEFGEIGIDGGFLQDAGINITEMNQGCICCSLVGDFGEALHKVTEQFAPDRIIIEPSGVGKLSEVRRAIDNVAEDCGLQVNSLVTVADAMKVKMYMKNFGEFYNDQIESAGTIILSRTQKTDQAKLDAAIDMIAEKNGKATIVTTPWDEIDGKQILSTMESTVSLAEELKAEMEEEYHHHDHDHEDHDHEEHDEHHHHDHDHEDHDHEDHDEHDHEDHDEHHHHDHDHEDHDHEEHDEHHHHDHDHEDHDHEEHDEHHHHDHDHEDHDHEENDEHHHHDHDHEDHDHDEHHHHDHDHEDHDHDEHHHHHHHHHHHGHDADEIFVSWGAQSPKKFSADELEKILAALGDEKQYGIVLRAKGMVPADDGSWLFFDMVPEESEIRPGSAQVTGSLCVIGSKLDPEKLNALFGVTGRLSEE